MIGDERYIDIPQRIPDPDGSGRFVANPEWLKFRAGCLTGSKVRNIRPPAELLKKDGTPRKIQELSARRKLIDALVFERETGLTMPGYQNDNMERGVDLEETALLNYQFKMGVEFSRVGFVLHPTISMVGASWDGYVAEQRRIIQVKCPLPHTHWSYLQSGEIPAVYLDQMTLELACEPEMVANDFVSYCPEMPAHWQLFIKRLERDNSVIAAMEQEAVKFLAEVDAAVLEFRERMKGVNL